MPRRALTDRFVATAKIDGAAQVDYFDEHSRGLALRVSARGRKAWTLIFTSPRDGKRARLTLGSYPATSLAQARTRAAEARGHAEAGQDPRDVFAQQVAGAMTVEQLVAAYLAKHARVNLRGAREVERRLTKNVIPLVGRVKLADLRRRDINRVVDPLVARGVLTEANRVFEDLRATFRWAVARGDLDHSPMEGMRRPATPTIRERVLTNEEVRALWTSLPKALARSRSCQRIVKLCLVTGQRVGEVSGMTRAELDLKAALWTLPGSRTKNGAAHTVPLSDLALEIIQEALSEAGKSSVVFPVEAGALPPRVVARTIGRAQEATAEYPAGRFGIAHWTAHDLRRTALTGMARLGVAPIVLGHVANHLTTTKAGVTLAVYTRHTYDEEKRRALDLWSHCLSGIVAGDAANIFALRA
jgi:integrase